MIGHWVYKGKLDTKAYGFLYLIINLINNKKYIGCKVFWFRRGKKVRESDWKTYQGSNKKLLRDIETLGKENFSFIINKVCYSKQELAYEEVKEIIAKNAIYSLDYYNEYVGLRVRNIKNG